MVAINLSTREGQKMTDESPFVANMVFCPKHSEWSDVIAVNQCRGCYAPGSAKDPKKAKRNRAARERYDVMKSLGLKKTPYGWE
jgi:hypothetical protein